jgi:translation initiation factor 2 alpha subunit (eIF-2alpha)
MTQQEGDVILCTVDKIDGTTVFVKTEDNFSGTIVFSEVAPGRIRNIRDYVVPNKKVACKVLRVSSNNIDLSLRRVTAKERTEVLELNKQEQTAKSAINSILKEKAESTKEKIGSGKFDLSTFIVNKAVTNLLYQLWENEIQ